MILDGDMSYIKVVEGEGIVGHGGCAEELAEAGVGGLFRPNL
jgi:hypothetical protein